MQRIHDSGGTIAALDLGLDPTTPTGEPMLTLPLAMAAWQRRQLADSWAVAQQRAVERGALAGRTPFGYERKAGGTLVPHPVEAAHVRRAFELSAAQGSHAASDYLAANVADRFWATATTRRTLARRVYLGESRHGQHVNLQAYEPLVDRALWEAAQRKPRAMVRSSDYPLSGIAICATCGSAMVAGPKTSSGKRAYRCSAAQTLHPGPRCVQPARIVAEGLESYVAEGLRPMLVETAKHASRRQVGGKATSTCSPAPMPWTRHRRRTA